MGVTQWKGLGSSPWDSGKNEEFALNGRAMGWVGRKWGAGTQRPLLHCSLPGADAPLPHPARASSPDACFKERPGRGSGCGPC